MFFYLVLLFFNFQYFFEEYKLIFKNFKYINSSNFDYNYIDSYYNKF